MYLNYYFISFIVLYSIRPSFILSFADEFSLKRHAWINIAKRNQPFLMFKSARGIYFKISPDGDCYDEDASFLNLDQKIYYSSMNVLRNYYFYVVGEKKYFCFKPIYPNQHSQFANQTNCDRYQSNTGEVYSLNHATNVLYRIKDNRVGFIKIPSNYISDSCRGSFDVYADPISDKIHITSFSNKEDYLFIYNSTHFRTMNLKGEIVLFLEHDYQILDIVSNQFDVYLIFISTNNSFGAGTVDPLTLRDTGKYYLFKRKVESFKKVVLSNRYLIAIFENDFQIVFEAYQTEEYKKYQFDSIHHPTNIQQNFVCGKNDETINDFFLIDPVIFSASYKKPPNTLLDKTCSEEDFEINKPIFYPDSLIMNEIVMKAVLIVFIIFALLILLKNFNAIKGSKDSLFVNALSDKQFLFKLKEA